MLYGLGGNVWLHLTYTCFLSMERCNVTLDMKAPFSWDAMAFYGISFQ